MQIFLYQHMHVNSKSKHTYKTSRDVYYVTCGIDKKHRQETHV